MPLNGDIIENERPDGICSEKSRYPFTTNFLMSSFTIPSH